MQEYKKLNYITILDKVDSFLSLDISVNSTGWVLKSKNSLAWGTIHLKSKDNRERRNEFAKEIQKIMPATGLDFIIIEDVIMGTNFQTTRALIELNTVVETLMDYDKICKCPVYRLDNKVWKRILNQLCQEETLKGVGDKEKVRFVLNTLGFDGVEEDTPQDVFDAMGIILAWIMKDTVDNAAKMKESNAIHKLHYQLEKCYKIKQYFTLDAMLSAAEIMQIRSKKDRKIVEVTVDEKYKDLPTQFKDIVEEHGDEAIFCFTYPLNRIGSLLITKDFNLKYDTVFFIARL